MSELKPTIAEQYLEVAQVILLALDRSGRVTLINRLGCEVLGVQSESLVGGDWFEQCVPDRARREVRDYFLQMMSGDVEPLDYHENPVVTRHQGERLIGWHNQLLRDGQDRIIGTLSSGEDITERRQTEERLRKLNQLHEDLLVPAPLDSRLKRITDGVVDALGADFARIWITRVGDRCEQGCMHAQVIDGPHACRNRQQCLHLLASSGRYTHLDGQTHGRVPFGSYKIGRVASAEEPGFLTNEATSDPRVHNHQWARELGLVSFAGYRLHSGAGDPSGVLALFSKSPLSSDDDALLQTIAHKTSEVIQAHEATEALRQSAARTLAAKEFTDTALDAQLDTFFLFEPASSKALRWNATFRELTGYTDAEIAELPAPAAYYSDEDLQRAASFVEQVMVEGTGIIELELICKDGRKIPTEYRLSVIREKQGPPRYLTAVGRDISERKRAERALAELEEQVRQSQKMEAVGRLAGGIAHDFNNLLTVINSYAQMAEADLRPGDPLKEDVREIINAGQRAITLTSQLLAFSRKQMLQPRVLDLNAVVGGLEGLLPRLIGEHIELTTRLAPELGRVSADPGQLEQILMNLVINARDAMPDGGTLTIETANVRLDEEFLATHVDSAAGPHVMLAVTDTGAGMSADVRERLFEPFFTTKDKGQGTGLGLSTVYGIVKQSGGTIWVHSEPGQGTTMTVYLPRVESPLAEPAPTPPAEFLSGSETILVVEDERAVRQLTRRILETAGYRVLTAANGGEALLICEQHAQEIQLVLTDVVMPKMSGKELADRLAQSHPELRVLYMSGYTDNAIVHHGVLDEDTQFISKPFGGPELLQKIRSILGTA